MLGNQRKTKAEVLWLSRLLGQFPPRLADDGHERVSPIRHSRLISSDVTFERDLVAERGTKPNGTQFPTFRVLRMNSSSLATVLFRPELLNICIHLGFLMRR